MTNNVELAGCRINSQICWDVRITQELHDARVSQLDTASTTKSNPDQPYRWNLFVVLPFVIIGLSGGVWFSSSSLHTPLETERYEEEHTTRRSRKETASPAR